MCVFFEGVRFCQVFRNFRRLRFHRFCLEGLKHRSLCTQLLYLIAVKSKTKMRVIQISENLLNLVSNCTSNKNKLTSQSPRRSTHYPIGESGWPSYWSYRPLCYNTHRMHTTWRKSDFQWETILWEFENCENSTIFRGETRKSISVLRMHVRRYTIYIKLIG